MKKLQEFRIFDKKSQKMYFFENVFEFDKNIFDKKNCEFMRSTGQIDKRGNIIYEGDIVQYALEFEREDTCFSFEVLGVCGISSGTGSFLRGVWIDRESRQKIIVPQYKLKHTFDRCEVWGNFYQNEDIYQKIIKLKEDIRLKRKEIQTEISSDMEVFL